MVFNCCVDCSSNRKFAKAKYGGYNDDGTKKAPKKNQQ